MRRILTFTALAAALAVSACSDPAQQSGTTSGAGSATSQAQARPPIGPGAMSEAERLAEMQRELQSTVGDRVYFGTDSIALSPDAKAVLDRQVAFLSRYPTIMLRIEGHADERGTREYNLALGDRRAQSTKEYLMARGVNANRLTTSSYGKERPEANGSNESSWSKNRRAVSAITQ